MNYFKLFLLFYLFVFSSHILAWNESALTGPFLTLNINQEEVDPMKQKEIENEIKKSLLNQELINSIDNVDITLNIKKNVSPISFSNAVKQCKVTLNYRNDKYGVFFNNFYQDLRFTLFHEISHCILGKDIFKLGIKWEKDLNLTNEEIKLINEKINKLTNDAAILKKCDTNCLPHQVFKQVPPLVIYHEMFADLAALYFYKKYDCNTSKVLLEKLINVRFDKFSFNSTKYYQSFRAFNYWENNCQQEIDFQKISLYTQLGFIDYLNEIK